MPDREKVLKGVECCRNFNPPDDWDCPEECPYSIESNPHRCCTFNPLLDDVITLLREQEPRVLTLEEIAVNSKGKYENRHVWMEIRPGYYQGSLDKSYGGKPYAAVICGYRNIVFRDEKEFYCQIEVRGGYEALFNVFNDYKTGYGVKWRCWTARPTDEEMSTTPWQD